MASLNKVFVIGNLTRDPELKYLQTGVAVGEFSIAANRTWTDKSGAKKEEVSFLDCVAWQKTAEIVAQYLKKGRPVLVEGRLQQERWEKDGKKHSRIKIHVENIQFLGAPPTATTQDGPAAEPSSDGGPAY